MIIKSTVQEVLSTILLDARGDIMGTGDIKTADLISELEYVSKSILYDSSSPDELREMGIDPDTLAPFSRDYSFTVDHSASYAEIPIIQ